MAFKMSLKTMGVDRTISMDRDLANRARDLRPAWRAIEHASARHQDRLFATRGASGGSGAWKPKKRPGGRLMQRTGRLRKSAARKGGERVFLHSKQEVYLWSSRVPYAVYHQDGRGGLPARRIIDPSTRDIEEYAEIIEQWILEGRAS